MLIGHPSKILFIEGVGFMSKKNVPTIPAPQNIKRREAFLLEHEAKMPKEYVHAQLLRIAMERAEKRLKWNQPILIAKQQERMKETAKMFTPIPKKQGFMSRVKGMFKSQRGN